MTQQAESIYTPHPWQETIHRSQAKNKVLEAARRLGKSRTAFWEMVKAFQWALQIPAPASLTPPFHAWVVTPTFPQAQQVWTELQAFLPADWLAGPPSQDRMQIRLKGSPNRTWGLIEVKSAHDGASLQTAGLDFLWVTEAQDVSEVAYLRMLPLLKSPDRLSLAVWEGIPALHSDDWFWRLCDYARDFDNPNYAYFHGTYAENPMLSQAQLDEIEAERELMTESAWKRMYLAERSESAGFFTNIGTCIMGDILTDPIPGARYIAGLDLGRKHDASVLWVADRTQRKFVHHRRWDAGEDWSMQREGVIRICNDWDVQRLVVDSTGMGGDIFSEALETAGLPVERYNIYTTSVKKDGILQGSRILLLNTLAMAMERQNISFPAEPHLLRELRAFQWVRKAGMIEPRPDHPEGGHDDEVFAMGLALIACDNPAPEALGYRRLGPMRYLPHDQESGRSTFVETLLRARRIKRLEERWQRSGITN